MNSTRTTNILLSVLLLVSIGNYLKTDSLGRDFVIQLEQMRIQQDIDLNAFLVLFEIEVECGDLFHS